LGWDLVVRGDLTSGQLNPGGPEECADRDAPVAEAYSQAADPPCHYQAGGDEISGNGRNEGVLRRSWPVESVDEQRRAGDENENE
jgi:hypothetical protein